MSAPPQPSPQDRTYFSANELAAGWRLSCRLHTNDFDGDVKIELPDEDFFNQNKVIAPEYARFAQGAEEVFLGLDMGTTAIKWRVVNAAGEVRAEGGSPNPQLAAGADVVSRLEFARAKGQQKRLADLIQNFIAEILRQLSEMGHKPARICVAANSVMTHIWLNAELEHFRFAPYALDMHGGEIIDLEFNGQRLPCVLPPLPAPFVGGDISAGLLAMQEEKLPTPALLIDLGTNAEFALLRRNGPPVLASAPLGPAMEGIGPYSGKAAGPGVAVAFRLGSEGISPVFFDSVKGENISATGYLSLLALLLKLDIMDRQGHFIKPDQARMPIAARVLRNLIKFRGQDALKLSGQMLLTADDVETLLKVKAILRVALAKTLALARLGLQDLQLVVLAGSIGENCATEDLTELGLVPPVLASRLRLFGNSSLRGACLLASRPRLLPGLVSLCSRATVANLADDPKLLQDYLDAMTWL